MSRHCLLFLAFTAAHAIAAGPSVLTVKTLTAQMRYDVAELHVQPGAPVTLRFENGDDLPHNFCLCDRGTDVVAMAMKQMDKPEEALKRNWLPDDKRIWAHTKLLNPKESETLTFTAPKEPGSYPYVCTFPGHAMTMHGVLKVFPKGGILKDLKFALYLGNWKHLPDFAKLTPHREGSVPDNLIQIKVDDYKNEFGVVFTGRLTVPREGKHTFYLTSDDGSRILVDGKQVVEYDGIHPSGDVKEGTVSLAKGEHEIRLEYFQAAGNIDLFAGWKGPGFEATPLSKKVPEGWLGEGKKKKDSETTGMPIAVTDEAVIYRNFIATVGNRSIGVGYPGGFNIAWNAETMNLVLLWRGAFIDAARHWNGRGGGAQPPLGYDVLRPAGMQTLPFATMTSPSADWPKLEPKERAAGYQFKGYHLDRKRLPTFNYEWNGAQVSDRFDPSGSGTAPGGRLVRTLTITGKVPENTWLRIATGKIEAKEGSFVVDAGQAQIDGHKFDNKCVIAAAGASIEGSNLVVPVKEGKIEVAYQWLK